MPSQCSDIIISYLDFLPTSFIFLVVNLALKIGLEIMPQSAFTAFRALMTAFGPRAMALAYRLDAIARGPKNSRFAFQGPTPSHLPSQWICTHQKHYARGRINNRCINS
jgi:hypothetical protein